MFMALKLPFCGLPITMIELMIEWVDRKQRLICY